MSIIMSLSLWLLMMTGERIATFGILGLGVTGCGAHHSVV